MFNNSKYTKYYFQIIEAARTKPESGYTERHHIIPRCLGGDESASNKVRLTARAHFVCHKLLVKMVQGQAKYKLLEALAVFSNNKNRKIKLNSRDIALIREANAVASSMRNKGNQHYLHRAPANAELKALRSSNATKSRWVNNGSLERFTLDHDYFVSKLGYSYGRLPFSQEWIAKITSVPNRMSTPEANRKKSETLRGRIKSAEHRRKLSESRKNEVPIKCQHCGKSTNQINFKKWHGENCHIVSPRAMIKCEHCGVEASHANHIRWHGANCRSIKPPAADSSGHTLPTCPEKPA